MNAARIACQPSWSTASLADSALGLPLEATVLGEHLNACRSNNGPLLALSCGAEALHGFVSARFVTTLTVLSLTTGCFLLVVL